MRHLYTISQCTSTPQVSAKESLSVSDPLPWLPCATSADSQCQEGYEGHSRSCKVEFQMGLKSSNYLAGNSQELAWALALGTRIRL